jgi:hypothetical protein
MCERGGRIRERETEIEKEREKIILLYVHVSWDIILNIYFDSGKYV